MKKIRYARMAIIFVLFIACVACRGKEHEGIVESTKENIDDVEDITLEVNSEVVYVTAEEYMDYYDLSEQDIPLDYVQSYLIDYPTTMETLQNWNDSSFLLEQYESGRVFGKDVNRIISGEKSFATAEDDFSDITHIILWYDKAVVGTEFSEDYIVVIDVNENMYYYNTDESDYTKADIMIEFSDEEIDELLEELKEIILSSWETPKYFDLYNHIWWNLYLIKEDGKIIAYNGCDPDEEGHPGFHEWFDKVCAVGNR